MVKFNTNTLDSVFAALADRTRRAIVAELASGGEMSISALASPFPISLPAIMKHLNVLIDAGLVLREKRGRTVHCRLNVEPLGEADEWISFYQQFWASQLDSLEEFLEQT